MYIEEVVERYGRDVYSFALAKLKNSKDASDVYQAVFSKLYEKKPSFASSRQLKSWLMKTVYNCAMDMKISNIAKVLGLTQSGVNGGLKRSKKELR